MTLSAPTRDIDTEDLQTAVDRALWEYDQVRGALSELSVEARHDGTVEISGHVRSGMIKDGVIETLRRVSGVTEIVDRLFSDHELEVAVASVLASIDKLAPGLISVHSHLGHVTLLGRLPSESLRSEVLGAASSVAGVEQVVDRMQGAQ
jgi:osmotically-inducible protein OsmY